LPALCIKRLPAKSNRRQNLKNGAGQRIEQSTKLQKHLTSIKNRSIYNEPDEKFAKAIPSGQAAKKQIGSEEYKGFPVF